MATDLSENSFCRKLHTSDTSRRNVWSQYSSDSLQSHAVPEGKRRSHDNSADSNTEEWFGQVSKRICDWTAPQELSHTWNKLQDAKQLRPILPASNGRQKIADSVLDNGIEDEPRDGAAVTGAVSHSSTPFTVDSDGGELTDINVNGGKLTLWQFLLELLMSGRYTNLIRWTNKQGEFILLQAESVAKLWGLRKDRNHRMNYDKLSRALRYYYEKNIIRKVHGHKFVYQFIGLQNLLKYCQTSACDEGLQTANRHVVAPGTEQDLQNKPSIGELSLVKDRESFYETRTHETSVTTWVHNRQQIMQTSPKEVVAVDQLEKHDPSVNKDYSERTVHKTNREASVSDCPSRTVGPSAEGCSLPPYSSYPFEVTNQSPIPNSPFVNSLNCDTVTTEKLIWLSSLFSSLASVVSLDQSFPPMPSSQTISLSQSPNVYPVVSSRRWSVNTEPSHVPPLRTLIDHLDAVQTLTPLSSHSLRNPTRVTISEGLHSTTIARNSKGLRQVVPGEPSQNDLRSNTTNANRTTYTPSDATQVYRSPSPHCQCSCHRSFSLESKQPATYLTSSVGDIYASDNSGPDVNRSPKVTEARIATDVSPTQLHHQRHTINMQRLEEQISKLGRTSLWNARAPHAVGACDFVRFCSTPRGMHSDQDTMASSTTHYSTDSLGVRQMNSPRTGESDDPANLGADARTSGDDQCVWMPVPLSMLTSWLQLLSTIRPSLCNDGITCPVEGQSNDGLTSGEETDSVRPAVSPTRVCDSRPLVVKQEVFDESGR